ncbi:hypothetical protein BDZ85DRAFT_195316 [Elsinoe ampelina]|uniref:Uncharacterized protein n=1 Tax=Elsinoe ampelina TaxID=302913 RepID=A0A6A6GEG4_9PEZI|nr:hypothetical protein BDZ85DRAFT_195316 [Elsinoe ampelina]
MKFILAAVLAFTAAPALGATLEARSVLNGPCSVPNSNFPNGTCITTTACANGGGTSQRGYCPGTPDNVRCCYKADCSGSRSACLWTTDGSCKGRFLTNLCPGPTNFKCCVV